MPPSSSATTRISKIDRWRSAIRRSEAWLLQRVTKHGALGFAPQCLRRSRCGGVPSLCSSRRGSRFTAPSRNKSTRSSIHAIFKDYTPLVEPLSLDEAYLDVTDSLSGIATSWETAKEIRARILAETELTASAGVSLNKFLAKLASDQRKPNGQFAIMPNEAEAFVAALPIAKFHGVGPKTAAKMHALGIETGADLRRQTLEFLRARFGKAGHWYFEIAWPGRSSGSIRPRAKIFRVGDTFSEDLVDPARIEAGVIAMAGDVWAWCEKTNCLGRTVTVKIKWADFQISSRSRSTEAPIETRAKLHELALELIRSVFPPPKAIRLVGVTLSNFRSPTAGSEAELPFREI
jgi:DNA polymerase IV